MGLIAGAALKPAWAAAVTGFQCFLSLGSYASQLKSATPYGKFAHAKELMLPVSGKLGMLFIYSPAFAWLGATQLSFISSISSPTWVFPDARTTLHGREAIVAVMLLLHFLKRIFETLFVHKYSGSSDGVVDLVIGGYYTLTCWIIMTFMNTMVTTSTLSSLMFYAGLSVYIVGELGNAYHHNLLADLRKSPDSGKKYVAPRGGLFEHVATPHYMFELVAWLGIAITAQQLNAFLVVLTMTSYLAGRAKVTNEWNMKNIIGYKQRKNIFPGIF